MYMKLRDVLVSKDLRDAMGTNLLRLLINDSAMVRDIFGSVFCLGKNGFCAEYLHGYHTNLVRVQGCVQVFIVCASK